MRLTHTVTPMFTPDMKFVMVQQSKDNIPLHCLIAAHKLLITTLMNTNNTTLMSNTKEKSALTKPSTTLLLTMPLPTLPPHLTTPPQSTLHLPLTLPLTNLLKKPN